MAIRRYFDIGLTMFLVFTLTIMTYLIFGLFKPFNKNNEIESLLNSDTIESILVSFLSIIITLFIVATVGTLLAYKMQKRKGKLYQCIHGLIMLPLLLPPTVAGLVLLQGFGSQSFISDILFEGELHLAFHFLGIVLTQVFVTLPYFYQMTLNAFNSIDDAYIEAAKVGGADSLIILKDIIIPMSSKSMGAGLFLSGLRGLSEFGATIMFAGNMVGKTQTMTTRIYQLYQVDIEAAFSLAGFQLLLFVLPFIFFIRKQHEA